MFGIFYLSLFDFQLSLLKSNRKTKVDFTGFRDEVVWVLVWVEVVWVEGRRRRRTEAAGCRAKNKNPTLMWGITVSISLTLSPACFYFLGKKEAFLEWAVKSHFIMPAWRFRTHKLEMGKFYQPVVSVSHWLKQASWFVMVPELININEHRSNKQQNSCTCNKLWHIWVASQHCMIFCPASHFVIVLMGLSSLYTIVSPVLLLIPIVLFRAEKGRFHTYFHNDVLWPAEKRFRHKFHRSGIKTWPCSLVAFYLSTLR